MANTKLETQVAVIIEKLESQSKRSEAQGKKIDKLLRIVVGVDGETSLVGRVSSLEREIKSLKSEFKTEHKPESYLSKQVKVRDMLLFFAVSSVWYIKESRDAFLMQVGQILKALSLFG